MFSSKRLVVAVLLVAVLGAALPSWGASFKKKTISDQQFFDMYKDGDTQGVINAINSGANINAKDKDGKTALLLAAEKGHTETVNALIEAGADDLADDNGRTALILAAYNGYAKTINALIDAGAYVKEKDKYGKMAVDYARDTLRGTNTFKRLVELSK